jgi:hypothetical protein
MYYLAVSLVYRILVCISLLQEAKTREANRLNKKRRARVQAKASTTSKSYCDGDDEEGEKGDEDVVMVEDNTPPKKESTLLSDGCSFISQRSSLMAASMW